MRIIIDIKNAKFKLFEVKDEQLKEDKIKDFFLEDKKKIVKYMNKSEFLTILLDLTKCIFSGESIQHYDSYLTDGRWIWSADIVHYVEKYNYILPLDFLLHIRQNNFKTYKLNDETYNYLLEKVSDKVFLNFKEMNKIE